MEGGYPTTANVLGLVAALLVFGGWALGPIVLALAGRAKRPPEGSYDEAWNSRTYDGAAAYFAHIKGADCGWVPVHICFTTGAIALTVLPALIWSRLGTRDGLAVPALLLAALGGFLGFVAVLLDLYGTPILARIVLTDPEPTRKYAAWLTWRYVEQWRERGLKSLSLLLLGLWMIWLWSQLQSATTRLALHERVLAWSSLVGGLVLAMLGITQFSRSRLLGQRGKIGAPLLLLVIIVWDISAAVWFVFP